MAELRFPALWRLLSQRPDLLAHHAVAYGALIEEQASLKFAGWRRTVIRQLAIVLMLGIALASAELAFLLWLVSTVISPAAGLAMLLAPLLPLAIALYLWLSAPDLQTPPVSRVFQEQMAADWQLLQDALP